MSKIKQAVNKLGNKIHGNRKLSDEELELFTEAVKELDEIFSKRGIKLPTSYLDGREKPAKSNEQAQRRYDDRKNMFYKQNRKVWNAVNVKNEEAIDRSIKHMSGSMFRSPFLKKLEGVGAEVEKDYEEAVRDGRILYEDLPYTNRSTSVAPSIKRSIVKNQIKYNQNFKQLPKDYQEAAGDIIDPTVPNRTTMISQIKDYWENNKLNSDMIMLNARQIDEVDGVINEINTLSYSELAFFYVVYYEGGDIFEQFRNPGSGGGGSKSLYTNGMADLRRKINASRGKEYGDVPNYFTGPATQKNMDFNIPKDETQDFWGGYGG